MASTLTQHSVFQQDHNNFPSLKCPVGFTTAALGGEIEIPTLEVTPKSGFRPKPRVARFSVCAARE